MAGEDSGAIMLPVTGEQVISIAFSLTKNSVSAFVAMFRKQLAIALGNI
jgi:hypothetical protein